MARGSVSGVSGCIIVLGAVFLGCGGDGADPATANPAGASADGDGSAGAADDDDAASVNDDRFAIPGATLACNERFSACGGLLASDWVVEDTCGTEVPDHDDAETWSRERLGLDAAACPGTVTRLDSTWSGQLSFREGNALDERRRTDALELDLTRECLSASFGVADTDVESTCAALSDSALECAPQGDACHCSARREEPANASGVYGVLGLSVAVGRSPTTRYEYCVVGDVLHWMESSQRIVLRRVPGTIPPGSEDPVETPR